MKKNDTHTKKLLLISYRNQFHFNIEKNLKLKILLIHPVFFCYNK